MLQLLEWAEDGVVVTTKLRDERGRAGEECGGWLRERVMSSYIYYCRLSVYALCVSVHPNSSHRHALLCFGKMQNQTLCGMLKER